MKKSTYVSGTSPLKREQAQHIQHNAHIISFPGNSLSMRNSPHVQVSYTEVPSSSSFLQDLKTHGIAGSPMFRALPVRMQLAAGMVYGLVAFCAVYFAI